MTRPAPRIDPRGSADLVRDTQRLAALLSPWRPPAEGTDLGGALIELFADMAGQVLDRLNAVPDRDFLAFLELLGVERLPARAARVPLTFSLPPRSNAEGFVPAGTPVATDGPVVARYVTERDLVVHAAALRAAVVLEPAADRIGDQTRAATGDADLAWPAFAGDSLIEHALYVASDRFSTLPRPRRLRITAATADPAALAALPVQWARWDGAQWQAVDATAPPGSTDATVDLGDVVPPEPVEVGGRTARWFRGRLRRAVGTVGPVPQIDGVLVTADVSVPATLAPAAMFAGNAPLDPAGDVFPFAEQPRFGAAWYVRSDVFGHAGAEVTVDVRLSEGAPAAQPSTTLVLAWEVGGTDGWVEVGRSGPGLPAGIAADLVDGTQAFTVSGQVRFPVPGVGAPLERNGDSGWWLRARIVAGNYGEETRYRDPTPAELGRNPQQTAVLVPATFVPPAVGRVLLGWAFSGAEPASVVTVDGETVVDQPAGAPFRPFRPVADDRPALHLGFDRPFPARPVSLYVQVEPVPYDPVAPPVTAAALPWEYATGGGWSDLHATDETRGLTRSGLVGFLGPADLQPATLFGRTLHWLRVRPGDAGASPAPRLRRILTNTVPADAAVPALDEVVGISDGSAGQIVRTTRAPVLAGELLEVLTDGTWAPWIRVPDFAASGPADPHYAFDADLGEVRFGDGRYGAVPPAGSALRLSYRSGGGAAGNRPTGAVHKLEVGLAAIDSVINLEPAAGGSDPEALDRVRARGPLDLRHGGRAVAAEDYADLAGTASPDVARGLTVGAPINPLDVGWIMPAPVRAQPAAGGSVLCHATAAEAGEKRAAPAGRVAVVVVPQSDAARPQPTQQLLEEVRDVLRARSPAVLGDDGLAVLGPAWVQVTVGLAVTATDLDAAQGLPAELARALDRFLHPLTGGPDGAGWAFGRMPHRSDLFSLVAGRPGVDHVVRLDVTLDPDPAGLTAEELARTLVWSGRHTVTVVRAEAGP